MHYITLSTLKSEKAPKGLFFTGRYSFRLLVPTW